MVLSTRRERRAKARFLQRHADRFDAVALRQPQRNFKQSRQHVHVFVAVKVRWPDACLAHLANLRIPFPLDFSERSEERRVGKECRSPGAADQREKRQEGHLCPYWTSRKG